MSTGSDWFRDDELLLREVRRSGLSADNAEATETSPPTPKPATLPKKIGRFHIKRVIASGGMGTVYEAMQEQPRRTVAVKVMKHGIASRSAMRRFEYESQVLARLKPGQLYWRTVFETRLINSLRNKGDIEGAETVSGDALEAALDVNGESRYAGTDLVREMMELAVFLVAKNRFLQHEWYCEDLMEVRQGSIPQGEPGIAGFVVIYASALVEQGKYAQAEPYLRHCLHIRKAALPQGDWHTAHVISVLGASLAGQDKFDDAEPMLLDGYHRMKDGPRTPPERVREAVGRIVDLYKASGKVDELAEWREILTKTLPTRPPESPAPSGAD